jgi:hypothetical protein
MSLEVPMLAAAVVEAIAAIPGAIRELRELSRQPGRESAALSTLVDSIRDHLIAFEAMSLWLKEAKVFHERLQNLDAGLAEIRTETVRATSQGHFNFQAFDMGKVRGHWKAARAQSLDLVLSFARTISKIEATPLVCDTVGRAISGPDWARRLVDLREKIDGVFQGYSGSNPAAIKEAADSLSELSDFVQMQLHLADEKIRTEATELGDQLTRLAGALRGV